MGTSEHRPAAAAPEAGVAVTDPGRKASARPPLVTVGIVAHDRPDDLARCLESLSAQDYQRLEVVVVDSGSCPPVGELRPLSGGRVPVIGVRTQRNVGPPAGRNLALDRAGGDILVWMDSDSWFPETDAIARIVGWFDSDPRLDILSYPVLESRRGGEHYVLPRPLARWAVRRPFRTSYFLNGACAMRRSVFAGGVRFDGELHYQLEELEFAWRNAARRLVVMCVPDVEVRHARRDSRRRDRSFFYYHTRNRVRIALRYLPLRFLIVHLSLWLTVLCVRAFRFHQQWAFLRGLGDALAALPRERRRRRSRKLANPTVLWLRRFHGRLYW